MSGNGNEKEIEREIDRERETERHAVFFMEAKLFCRRSRATSPPPLFLSTTVSAFRLKR